MKGSHPNGRNRARGKDTREKGGFLKNPGDKPKRCCGRGRNPVGPN